MTVVQEENMSVRIAYKLCNSGGEQMRVFDAYTHTVIQGKKNDSVQPAQTVILEDKNDSVQPTHTVIKEEKNQSVCNLHSL